MHGTGVRTLLFQWIIIICTYILQNCSLLDPLEVVIYDNGDLHTYYFLAEKLTYIGNKLSTRNKMPKTPKYENRSPSFIGTVHQQNKITHSRSAPSGRQKQSLLFIVLSKQVLIKP